MYVQLCPVRFVLTLYLCANRTRFWLIGHLQFAAWFRNVCLFQANAGVAGPVPVCYVVKRMSGFTCTELFVH
jgi:hypothetical protein